MRGIYHFFFFILVTVITLPSGSAFGDSKAPNGERITYHLKTTGGDTISMDTTVGIALGNSLDTPGQAQALQQIKAIITDAGRPLMLYVPKGETVPAQVEATLYQADIPYEIIPVSTQDLAEVGQARRDWVGNLRARAKHVLAAKPSSADWFLGITIASYSGAAGIWAWAHNGTLDPWTIGALSAYEALVMFFQTTHIHRIDRFFSFKADNSSLPKRVSFWTQVLKRAAFAGAMAETMRAFSVPWAEPNSVMSLAGQVDVAAFTIAYGLGYATFNTVRESLYSKRPNVSRWANFNQYLLMGPLMVMDWAGLHLATVFETSYYELHLSTALILAGYAGVAAGLKYVKPMRMALESISSLQEKFLNRGILRISTTRAKFKTACRRLVRGRNQ